MCTWSLDGGYSRYVVHWDLLTSMRAADVRLVIEDALERTGARPRQQTARGIGLPAARGVLPWRPRYTYDLAGRRTSTP